MRNVNSASASAHTHTPKPSPRTPTRSLNYLLSTCQIISHSGTLLVQVPSSPGVPLIPTTAKPTVPSLRVRSGCPHQLPILIDLLFAGSTQERFILLTTTSGSLSSILSLSLSRSRNSSSLSLSRIRLFLCVLKGMVVAAGGGWLI